jgi:hypothetical protein
MRFAPIHPSALSLQKELYDDMRAVVVRLRAKGTLAELRASCGATTISFYAFLHPLIGALCGQDRWSSCKCLRRDRVRRN